jgi:hypothetical protein
VVYGLFVNYVNWFSSSLTNRLSHVRYSGALSTPFEVLSSIPQGSVLGPLLFNVLLMIYAVLLNFPVIFFLLLTQNSFGQ